MSFCRQSGFLLLGALFFAGASLAGDWEVTTSAVQKQRYVWDRLYGGIKTQEKFDEAFKKAIEKDDGGLVRYLDKIARERDLEIDWYNNGSPLLLFSAKQPGCSVIQTLLTDSKSMASSEDSQIWFATDSRKRTLLHLAIYSANMNCVKALLKAKNTFVDIEALDGDNNTPLAAALVGRDFAFVRALVAAGADTEIKVNGKPLIEYAFERDNPLAVQLLAPTAKKLFALNFGGGKSKVNALQFAAMNGAYHTAAWLMRQGFDPTVSEGNTLSPYRLAVLNAQWNVVMEILDRHPDLVSSTISNGMDLVAHALDTNEVGAFEIAKKFHLISEAHYWAPNSAYRRILATYQEFGVDLMLLRDPMNLQPTERMAREFVLAGESVGFESVPRRKEYDALIRTYEALAKQKNRNITPAHLSMEWQSFRNIYTLLDVGIARGNTALVKALLDAGADTTGPNRVSEKILSP